MLSVCIYMNHAPATWLWIPRSTSMPLTCPEHCAEIHFFFWCTTVSARFRGTQRKCQGKGASNGQALAISVQIGQLQIQRTPLHPLDLQGTVPSWGEPFRRGAWTHQHRRPGAISTALPAPPPRKVNTHFAHINRLEPLLGRGGRARSTGARRRKGTGAGNGEAGTGTCCSLLLLAPYRVVCNLWPTDPGGLQTMPKVARIKPKAREYPTRTSTQSPNEERVKTTAFNQQNPLPTTAATNLGQKVSLRKPRPESLHASKSRRGEAQERGAEGSRPPLL